MRQNLYDQNCLNRNEFQIVVEGSFPCRGDVVATTLAAKINNILHINNCKSCFSYQLRNIVPRARGVSKYNCSEVNNANKLPFFTDSAILS